MLREIVLGALAVLAVSSPFLFDLFYTPALRPYEPRYRDWLARMRDRSEAELAADVALLEPRVMRRLKFRRKATLTQIVRGVRAYPPDVERAVVSLTERGVIVPQWPARALDEQCPYRLAARA